MPRDHARPHAGPPERVGQQLESRGLRAWNERRGLGQDESFEEIGHLLLALTEPVQELGPGCCEVHHLVKEAGNGNECESSIEAKRDGLR